MTKLPLSPKKGVTASLVVTLLVAWMDYATGLELKVTSLYILPVLLAAWYTDKKWALFLALVNAIAWSLVDALAGPIYSHPLFQVWQFINHALVYLAVALAVGGLRRAVLREKYINAELNQALTEVGELKGLLPVCAWCHKIRDDKGYWGQLETYIEARSRASFTHGICPDCQSRVMAERSGYSGEQPALATPPPRSPST